MSNGPLPSTLTFLSSLNSIPIGSKVRFLGCVTSYKVSSATLSLQHPYQSSQAGPTIALVDVTLLLESLKREDTQIGAWVNIIGYVEGSSEDERAMKKGVKRGSEGVLSGGDSGIAWVRVKAIMLWSAGGVKMGEYEKALEDRLRIQNKDP